VLYSRVEATGAAIGDMEFGRVVVLPVVGEILWVLELLARLIERRVSAVRSAYPAAWDSLRVFWGSDDARVDGGADGGALVALDPRVEVTARRTSEVTDRRSATSSRLTALSQISRDPNSASKHFRTNQLENLRVEDAVVARVDLVRDRARVLAVVDLVVEGFDLVQDRHLVRDGLVGDHATSHNQRAWSRCRRRESSRNRGDEADGDRGEEHFWWYEEELG
jgi:hypothetical protein